MNKDLCIKRNNQLENLKKLKYIVESLDKFLNENEEKFKRKESIEALKIIKNYYENKKREYIECKNKERELEKNLYSTCSHEVSIKCFNLQYQCLICGHDVGDSLISIDISNDRKCIDVIEKIFNDVIYTNKDLVETLSEKLEEIQYDRNIKIYRRKR